MSCCGRRFRSCRVATAQVGDPQVRHRGTIGGSIAHGDPASDLPAVLLALRRLAGRPLRRPRRAGHRRRRASSPVSSRRRWSPTSSSPRSACRRFRTPGGRSRSSTAGRRTGPSSAWRWCATAPPGVGLVNMGSTPLRATAVEQALAGGASVDDAAQQAAVGAEPQDDLNATAEYRRTWPRCWSDGPFRKQAVDTPTPQSRSTPSGRRWPAPTTSPTRAWPPPSSSPCDCSDRCCSRASAGVGKTEVAKAVSRVVGRRADPAAVLRGDRRVPGRLRVGLRPPAAAPAGGGSGRPAEWRG